MKDQDIPGIFSFVSLRNHTASLDLLVGVFVIGDTLQQWVIGSILQDILTQVFTALGDLKGKQKKIIWFNIQYCRIQECSDDTNFWVFCLCNVILLSVHTYVLFRREEEIAIPPRPPEYLLAENKQLATLQLSVPSRHRDQERSWQHKSRMSPEGILMKYFSSL